MDAARYFALAKRWWWVLVLGMVVAVGGYVAASATNNATQVGYQATTTLLVAYDADAPQVVGLESYAQLITGRRVMEQTITDLGLSDTVEAMQDRVQAVVPAGTELVQVVASGEAPQEAEQLAMGVAQAFSRQHEAQRLPGSVFIYEYEPARAVQSGAVTSVAPASVLVLLAALLGVVVAGGAVLAIDYLSDAVKAASDAEKTTGLPVLAAIPAWSSRKNAECRLAADREDANAARERYRMLRTSFALRTADEPVATVLFAAGLPGEGTSTTAANFAVALAQTGRRVALVDTNLRSPSLHETFGLPNEDGLTQALAGDPPVVDSFLRPTEFESLTVVTSGPASDTPSELLASDRFDRLLALLGERFETVVLDSPPTLTVTDATVLAAKADATIIVVRAESTSHAQLEGTAESLRRTTSRMLGVVLNREVSAVSFGLPRLRLGRARAVRRGDAEADLQTESTRQIAPRRETA